MFACVSFCFDEQENIAYLGFNRKFTNMIWDLVGSWLGIAIPTNSLGESLLVDFMNLL